jgi:UDP-N-acetylmuramyl tripeptide synthase
VLGDSRRLTGRNLLLESAGAVIDATLGHHDPARFAAAWGAALDRALAPLAWQGAARAFRAWPGGVTVAFAAPIDALYVATEVAEWAFAVARVALDPSAPAAPVFEPEMTRLRALLAAEVNPALLRLREEGARRGLTCLSDDRRVSLGLGTGSRSWPVRRLGADPARIRWNGLHDVPVALVTGTNGKTTTVRLLGAIARAAGIVAGATSTDCLQIGDEVIAEGDYSGPNGARTILRERRVQLGVLEVARGGILRRGLPVGSVDAAVVTNVAEDHLGEYGIFDAEALADTKLVVAGAVGPKGRVVLNADDARLLERGQRLASPVLWCTLDAGHTEVQAHRSRGGDAAWLEDGALWLAASSQVTRVVEVSQVPISFGGAARYNLLNALAAIGAASALALPVEAMREGLRAFAPTPESNPGRANVWHFGACTAVVDFAHNPHGLLALAETVAAIPAARRGIVLGQAGDRDDSSIRALARGAFAMRPDRVFLKDMEIYWRGRGAGEIPAILEAELLAAGALPDSIESHGDELSAIRAALRWARQGDLLLLTTHADRDAVFSLMRALVAARWLPGQPLPA